MSWQIPKRKKIDASSESADSHEVFQAFIQWHVCDFFLWVISNKNAIDIIKHSRQHFQCLFAELLHFKTRILNTVFHMKQKEPNEFAATLGVAFVLFSVSLCAADGRSACEPSHNNPSIQKRLQFSLSRAPLFYSRANSLTHNLHNNRRGWARKLEWSRRKESRPGNHVNDVPDCELRRWRPAHHSLSLSRLNFVGLARSLSRRATKWRTLCMQIVLICARKRDSIWIRVWAAVWTRLNLEHLFISADRH